MFSPLSLAPKDELIVVMSLRLFMLCELV